MSTTKVRAKAQHCPDPSGQSLDALMKAYRNGSTRAFARLHARLQPYVRRQIAARVRRAADVDDLTQLTFLRVHAARARYQAPHGARDRAVVAWVCTIARNTAISHIRRVHGDRLCFDGAAQRTVDEAASEYTPPADLSARDEAAERTRAAVREAVAALPEGQREVVERSKFHGLPMKDVASELGVRPVAVRVRAHRAYKNLRQTLEHMRRLLELDLSAV
ncbi:MAG: sigma-70 family RNA polymerase sigma factor [Myxococcota bacterium]